MIGCRSGLLWLTISSVAIATVASAGDPAPERIQKLLGTFCLDCHNPSVAEGGVGLDVQSLAWSNSDIRSDWETVHEMIERRMMPPPDADAPTDAQRELLLGWLDRELMRHSPLGDGKMRRLSRREYQNTVRELFDLPHFELPATFPPDAESDGFDNQTKNLALSASHLEAFQQSAEMVADEFFAPRRGTVESQTVSVPASDLVISYSSACLIDDQMRLASQGILLRNGTWPTKFVAPANGTYRFEVNASSMIPERCPTTPAGHVPQLTVESVSVSTMVRTGGELIATFDVHVDQKSKLSFTAQLDRGETIALRYANSPFCYDEPGQLTSFLRKLFDASPELAAAWQKVGKPARGGNGWSQVVTAMESMQGETPDPGGIDEKFISSLAKKKVDVGETLVYRFFEQGPWLAIDSIEIEGPMETFPDRDDLRREKQRRGWLSRYRSNPDIAINFAAEESWDPSADFFYAFLRDAYRRTPTSAEVQSIVDLFTRHRQQTGSTHEAFHVVIRTVLISPAFLFRGTDVSRDVDQSTGQATSQLTEHGLANRIAYFLTSAPPDDSLVKMADASRLHHSFQLRKQVRRLLAKADTTAFAGDFANQWLALSPVDRLMPDQRLIRQFPDDLRRDIKAEPTGLLTRVLVENLSVRNLVAPDFVLTTPSVAKTIYGIGENKSKKKGKAKSAKSDRVTRYDVPRFGHHGGVLCMAATMMATANGVDTQPVLRGVWVLDKITGMPPPEPPDAVPALTPDVTGASTPKERLAAHMADASCAQCHREIDPMGFVLENFDPVGRWRESYPANESGSGKKGERQAMSVDASGVLADGTLLNDVTDLKRWLDAHPDVFARALSEELLIYATGRDLNYRERAIVADIVERNAGNDFRFRDLIEDLVDSPVFRRL